MRLLRPDRSASAPSVGYRLGEVIRFGGSLPSSVRLISNASHPEESHQWLLAPHAYLQVRLDAAGFDPLLIRINGAPFLPPWRRSQEVALSVNGMPAAQWWISRDDDYFGVVSTSALAGRRTLDLDFYFPNATSPAKAGVSEDQRILGLALRELSLHPYAR
ncbi:MAG: hypothetical protein EA425_05390 [Puniceicoccaceae bacterium]|nr:MAG: hypothetical protein EA425_05390 [Puniceicoccaceae bacterium]